MLMNKIIHLMFFMVLCSHSQNSMTNEEANDLRIMVSNFSKTINTITSDFVQYKHLSFLDNEIETSGKLLFKTPGIVKWEYKKPFNYSVLFKEGMLYINDEGNKSEFDIDSNKIFRQLNNLIINSVKGDMFDDSEFTIEYFKKDISSVVYFYPKDRKLADIIKAFQITFNFEGAVIEVTIVEESNDYTKIVFTNKDFNKDLPDALFSN